MSELSINPELKQFQISDIEKGIFVLYDKVFSEFRKWEIDPEASPGYSYMQQKLEKESTEIYKELPKDFSSLTKLERSKKFSAYLDTLDKENKDSFLKLLKKNSEKNLAITSSIIQPLFEIPDIWENKIEALAVCISHESDLHKINDFFLMKLSGYTIQQGESKEKDPGKN